MANQNPSRPTVLAAVTHPDDIKFLFAGTLLLLREAGCEIHFWNLANGCLGSMTHPADELARIRYAKAEESARLAQATLHPPLFDDLAVFYDRPSLARVAAVVRSIRPQIILTHSLQDYMEDHQNVARLVVTAAFSRSIPAFETFPAEASYSLPVRIYHAAPHGLKDGMGEAFRPDFLVDISGVIKTKEAMLACHRSQKDWLEASQGMGAYVSEMVAMARESAAASPALELAESWRRHSPLGFCPADFDPLAEALSPFIQNRPARAGVVEAAPHTKRVRATSWPWMETLRAFSITGKWARCLPGSGKTSDTSSSDWSCATSTGLRKRSSGFRTTRPSRTTRGSSRRSRNFLPTGYTGP